MPEELICQELHVVFLLEEISAKEMLCGIWDKIVSTISRSSVVIKPHYYSFEGKKDLIQSFPKKIQGWKAPNSIFIILLDQDSSDCKELKREICSRCTSLQKKRILVRIACHELENFYLGDLQAIDRAYNLNISNQQFAKFKTPDKFHNAPDELKKLTNGRYQKVLGSRSIARYLDLSNNFSKSFQVLLDGILRHIQP